MFCCKQFHYFSHWTICMCTFVRQAWYVIITGGFSESFTLHVLIQGRPSPIHCRGKWSMLRHWNFRGGRKNRLKFCKHSKHLKQEYRNSSFHSVAHTFTWHSKVTTYSHLGQFLCCVCFLLVSWLCILLCAVLLYFWFIKVLIFMSKML